MLVVLAILAAITAISATALRPPSPALQLDRAMADLLAQAATARAEAVRGRRAQPFELPQCGGDPEQAVFYPDGTAQGAGACLAVGGIRRNAALDPLTGRLYPEAAR